MEKLLYDLGYNQGKLMGEFVGRVEIKIREENRAEMLSLKQKVKKLECLKDVATELVEYTSYSDASGGIGINRSEIRKACDEVLSVLKAID